MRTESVRVGAYGVSMFNPQITEILAEQKRHELLGSDLGIPRRPGRRRRRSLRNGPAWFKRAFLRP
jgi:hypothetical protein